LSEGTKKPGKMPNCLPQSISRARLFGAVLSSVIWTALNVTLSLMNKYLFVVKVAIDSS
jgi:hypothetical protein